jgi:hypothetical protein
VEAADVADRGNEAGGHGHVDSGDGHQSPDLARGQRVAGDQPLHRGDLGVGGETLEDVFLELTALLLGVVALVSILAARTTVRADIT